MKVSVIIPALNESGNIEGAVRSALSAGDAEVIVADRGSSDSTAEKALALGAKVVNGPRGRGAQMDAGAASAKGEVLLFLHADTRLPDGWKSAVRKALEDREVMGGGFRISIDSGRPIFRLLEAAINLRARLLGLIYGDQALFFRKTAFLKAGGFRNLPLMEDVDCVKRLRGFGRVVLVNERVKTSSRGWDKGGVIRASLRNWRLLLLYYAGTPPHRLYERYYGPVP